MLLGRCREGGWIIKEHKKTLGSGENVYLLNCFDVFIGVCMCQNIKLYILNMCVYIYIYTCITHIYIYNIYIYNIYTTHTHNQLYFNKTFENPGGSM